MDIDVGILSAICREGMSKFLNEGVSQEMFDRQNRAWIGYQFMQSHWQEYGKVPEPEVIHKETGVNVRSSPVEPISFWTKQIKKRYLYRELQPELDKVADHMEKVEVDEVIQRLGAIYFKFQDNISVSNRPVPMFEDVDSIWDDIEAATKGLTGVETPWKSLNQLTRGWQPADLVVFAARPGIGKTWLLMILCYHAWVLKKKILIASTEMSFKALRLRMAALACKIQYSKLRNGELTSFEKKEVRDKLVELKEDKNLMVMGDSFDLSINSIEAATIELNPDLLCIDGIYHCKAHSTSREKRDRIGDVLEACKSLGKRRQVPILATSQLNRSSDKNKKSDTYDLSRMAFTDTFGMICDYIFFLKQTKEMRENGEMEIQPGKVREADFISNVRLNWKFHSQEFSEIEKKNEDDDKGNEPNRESFSGYTPEIPEDIPD